MTTEERTEKIENEIKDLVLGKKDAKELVYAFQKEDVEDEAFDPRYGFPREKSLIPAEEYGI